jgi:hypothetical protein
VSFASKPRLTNKSATDGGAKRPAFIVVRKKAAIQSKKKLTEVKSFISHENTAVKSSQITDSYVSKSVETLTSVSGKKVGVDTNFLPINSRSSVTRKSVTKKSTWTVSEKSKNSSTNQHSNTGVISSLFMKNPEIPVMKKDNVESTQENVFSAQSFGSLKIHKHLVCYFIFSRCVP